jgi:hypothetical protein
MWAWANHRAGCSVVLLLCSMFALLHCADVRAPVAAAIVVSLLMAAWCVVVCVPCHSVLPLPRTFACRLLLAGHGYVCGCMLYNGKRMNLECYVSMVCCANSLQPPLEARLKVCMLGIMVRI